MRYWINVTKDCNLKCTYCYQKDYHQSVYMDEQVADQVIDFIVREGAEESAINFFGGEALLNFNIIRYIVERLAVQGVHHFSITTNLVALTDEMVNFFNQYHFNLLVSFDGTRESQDAGRMTKNGKGTFEYLLTNLDKLKKVPNVGVRIAKVLSLENFPNFYQDYLLLKDLGYRVLINTLLDGMYIDDDQNIEVYQKQVELVLADFLKSDQSQFPNLLSFYNRYKRLSYSGAFKEDSDENPCTKPDNLQLVFDCVGKIHPCHMMVELDLEKTGLAIGTGEKPKKLREQVYTSNPGFAPFKPVEVYTQLEQEITMKDCNQCRYLHNCLDYFLMHSKTSCIFKRLRRRQMEIDDSKRLLCYSKMVLDGFSKLVGSSLQIGGEDHV